MKKPRNKKAMLLAIVSMLILSTFIVGIESMSGQGYILQDAKEIEVPGEWSGTLNETNEMDLYTFELEPSQIVEIEFSSNAANDQKLTFYDFNQEPVFELRSSNSILSRDDFSLANETETDHWFISVTYGAEYQDWHGNYGFSISIDYQNDAGSGGDVASTFDQAYEIEEGEYSGMIRDLDTRDMYKIELESSSIIEIEFQSYASDNQELTFYAPNRDLVFNLRSSEERISRDDFGLANETETVYWFIGITYGADYQDWHGDYTFTISIDYQNDAGSGGDVASSFDQAYEIGEGEYSGMIRDLDTRDMYKIELESSSIIEIEFVSEAEDNQELTFYDPDRNSLFDLRTSEGTPISDDFSLANETETDYWFIGITYEADYQDWHGDYTFEVKIGSQDDAGSGGDVASTFDQAYEIGEGEYTGMIRDLDTRDMYKIELAPNSVIELEFSSEAVEDQALRLYNNDRDEILNLQASREDEPQSGSYLIREDVEQQYWYIGITYRAHYQDWHGSYSFKITTEDPEPMFQFSNLRAEPSVVSVGQELEFLIDVENVGTGSGSYTVEFYVDGVSIGSSTVEVEPGESETASVVYSEEEIGIYNLEAEGFSTEFTVEEFYDLTILIDGDGSVTLEAYDEYEEEWVEHPGSPIDEEFTDHTPEGTQVRLIANPSEGWEFVEWVGNETGTATTIEFTMDGDKEIAVIFEEFTYTLVVTVEGEGTVDIEPDIQEYTYGTEVTLKATPLDGWELDSWDGTDESGEEITITMDEDKEITAVFEMEEDEDPEGFLDDLLERGMMCLTLGIIVIIIVIVIIVVVVVKMMGDSDKGSKKSKHRPPPGQTPPSSSGEESEYGETPPPPPGG